MNANKKTVRIAGFGYLIIILAVAFAKVFIRFKLIVQGDSPTKAKNITVSERLFRHSSASDLIVLSCDVVVALTLFVLLKPANRSLVLLAAFFRLVHTAIHGINLLYCFLALQPFSGANYLTVSEPDRLHSIHIKSFPGLQRQILMEEYS